jgi:HEAT repeat protein
VRITAHEALRDIADPRSFAAVRRGLQDRSPLVRSSAAVAASLVDPVRARPILHCAVRRDRSSTAGVGLR